MSENDIDLAALDRDLQKLPKSQRGWWSRNWKRLVLLLVLLLVAGVAYSGWYFSRLLRNESYQQAMRKISENKEVTAALGEPIKLVYFAPPPSFFSDGDNFEMRWEVIGFTQKQAKAHVKTRLMNGKWETVLMEIKLPGGKNTTLTDDEGGNLPPIFNAPPAGDKGSSDKTSEDTMPDDLSPKIPPPEESK